MTCMKGLILFDHGDNTGRLIYALQGTLNYPLSSLLE